MNFVRALLPSDPVTSTMNRPSFREWGKSRLMFRRTVPSAATVGLTCAMWSNVWLGASCGGLSQVSETVTDVRGAKPRPWTTHVAAALPSLWFSMHREGPLVLLSGVPHTVFGATGGASGTGTEPDVCVELTSDSGELELLSAAPRTTPTTTRAAPTEAHPAQAMCDLSQRRQPTSPAPGDPVPGLRRGTGL